VASYVQALQCTVGEIPLAFASERLSEFRKSYPEAYRIGSDKRLLSGIRKADPPRYWNRQKPWEKY